MKLLVCCAGLAALCIAPALGATVGRPAPAMVRPALTPSSDNDQSAMLATTSSLPLERVGWPDTTPSVVPAYVVMELEISGTPCFNCVNGQTAGTFGSGYPLGYVNLNTSAVAVLFEWFDVSYKGSCSLSVTLSLAGKVLKSAKGTGQPTVGSVENTQMNVTRSSSWHGAATMVAKAVCGGTTAEGKGIVHFE